MAGSADVTHMFTIAHLSSALPLLPSRHHWLTQGSQITGLDQRGMRVVRYTDLCCTGWSAWVLGGEEAFLGLVRFIPDF